MPSHSLPPHLPYPQVHRVKFGVLGAYIPTQPHLIGRAVLRVPPPPRGADDDAPRFCLAVLPLASPDAPPAVVDVEAQLSVTSAAGGSSGCPTLELAWRLASPDAASTFEAEVPVTLLPRAALGYGHGGFMGLAASMMSDERWRTILALEDAPSHERATGVWHAAATAAARGDRDRGRAANKRLMTLLENSPVLCAYGMLRWGAVRGRGAPSPEKARRPVAVSLTAVAAGVDDAAGHRRSSDVGAPPSPAVDAGDAAVPLVEVGASTTPPRELSPMPRPPLATVDEASALELSSLGQAASAAAAVAASRDLPREGGRADAAPVMRLPAAPAHHRSSTDGTWGVRALMRSASDAWTLPGRRGGGGGGTPPQPVAPSPTLSRDARVSTVPARLLAEWAADAESAPPWPARGPPPSAPSASVVAAAETPMPPPQARAMARPPVDVSTSTAPFPPSPPVGGGGAPPLAPWVVATSPLPPPPPRHRWSDAGLVTPAAPLPGECDPGSEDEDDDEEDGGRDSVTPPPASDDAAATTTATPQASHRVAPVPIEWDVWLCPRAPWLLQAASVDHGSLRRLAAQAVYARLPGCSAAARRAGRAGIARDGVSPVAWLSMFGRAVNRAVNGDPDVPVDGDDGVHASFRHRVSVDVSGAILPPSALHPHGATFYARATIVHGAARVVPVRTAAVAASPDGRVAWKERLSFWPVDAALPPHSRVALRVEVRRLAPSGGGAVTIADTWVARVELPLGRVVADGHTGVRRWWRAGAARRRAAAPHPAAPAPPSTDPSAHGGRSLSPQLTGVTVVGLPGAAAACVRRGARVPTASDDEVTEPPPITDADGATPATLRLRVTLDRVPTLDAAVAVGVDRAAADTASALLSAPGGVVLDVKSAYSTPRDLELFCGALDGIGVTVRAVASFRPAQLDGVARRRAPSVTLFHGLASLEAACDAGAVKSGGCVFFNGASLLRDAAKIVAEGGDDATRSARVGDPTLDPSADPASHPLVDPAAWARYTAAVAGAGVAGGVYIQEACAAPAAVDALSALAAHAPHALPLGFAYGGAPGRAPAAFGSAGRGFGQQAIIEDVAARTEARAALRRRVDAGDAATVPPPTAAVWAGRLLYGGMRDVSLADQRSVVRILCDAPTPDAVLTLIARLGGLRPVLVRFHAAYEAAPWTALGVPVESGFNFNASKALLRALRDRGGLAALPRSEKAALASFLASPPLYGWGLTYLLQASRLRVGLHKHAKEGVACLLESCGADDAAAVVSALRGPTALDAALRGRCRLSVSYAARVAAITALHALDASALPYCDPRYPFAAPPSRTLLGAPGTPALHTRSKTRTEATAKLARKLAAVVAAAAMHAGVAVVTCGAWAVVAAPRAAAPALRGVCGAGVLALALGMAVVVAAAYAAVWATVGIDVRAGWVKG